MFDFVVLRLEVGLVGLSDLNNLITQFGCFVVFESIRFPLERRLRRQLHVFGLVVNVFLPGCQPLPSRVMANVSPCMPGNIAPRNCGAFRKVEGDLFGCYPRLELSHLWMFPAPPKGTGWFHVVVSNLLYVPVYLCISELEHGLVAIIFVGLAFLVGNSLSDDLLLLQVFPNGCKVAFFKVLDYMTSAKSRFKICKEIFDKDLSRLWIPQVHSIGIHRGKKCGTAHVGKSNDRKYRS